jgi:plasmid stabilization system protein ParE
MRIRWTPAAAADLQHISDYLRERHPHYRLSTMRKLYETVRSLRQWPDRGSAGSEEGTRELFFPPLPCTVQMTGALRSFASSMGLRIDLS